MDQLQPSSPLHPHQQHQHQQSWEEPLFLPPAHSTPPTARFALLALAGMTTFSVYLFVSCLGPFFTELAQSRYHSTPLEVGVVFGLYPLAKALGSPIASVLSERWGRLVVWVLGLVLLAGAAILFGLGDSMALFMISRALKGFAGALCVVSCTATVITHSNNVSRDIGLLEVLGGLGYMLGPAIGGLLFSKLGLRDMFLYTTAIPILLVPVVMVSFFTFGYNQRNEVARKMSSGIRDNGNNSKRWKVIMSEGAVLVCVLALIGNAMAWAFMDLALAQHLQAVLHTSTQLTGLAMSVPALSYTIIAPTTPYFCQRYSMKTALLTGLALLSLSFLLIGPSPPLTFLVPLPSLAWVTITLCLILIGIGSSLIVVPAVPMMMEAMQERKPDDADSFNDIISGVYHSGWSFGDFVGPLMGGYLLQQLPSTLEPLCKATPDHSCRSQFGWVATVYCVLLACCFIAIVTAHHLGTICHPLLWMRRSQQQWRGEKNLDRYDGVDCRHDESLSEGILPPKESS